MSVRKKILHLDDELDNSQSPPDSPNIVQRDLDVYLGEIEPPSDEEESGEDIFDEDLMAKYGFLFEIG